MSYDDLDIHNDSMVMASWYEFVFKSKKEEDIKDNLLKYCELDTIAMVRIWEEIKKIL